MTANTDTQSQDAQYGLTGRRAAAALAEEQQRKRDIPDSSSAPPRGDTSGGSAAEAESAIRAGEVGNIVQPIPPVDAGAAGVTDEREIE